MQQNAINEITSIILCNYPYFMNDLEDLQSNWNDLEARIDKILTQEVYSNCLLLISLYDIFYYSVSNSIDINSISSLSDETFNTIKEKFKVYLKNLFAKTNKSLIKIIKNYPEKIRNNVFYMFTETTSNKILKCESLEELNDCLNKNFDILYLLMTSARANIWKDDKIDVPDSIMSSNNIQLAIVVLMNSIFSYYGEYRQSGGKCFSIKFNNDVSLKLLNSNTNTTLSEDKEGFNLLDKIKATLNKLSKSDSKNDSKTDLESNTESTSNNVSESASNSVSESASESNTESDSKNDYKNNNLTFSISVDSSKQTFKNTTTELTKYNNPTLFISELLLNSQNPFDNNYELIPSISADMFSIDDILQMTEEYGKQVNKEWLTFADVLIGFDDKDTYRNQTFKRLVYNTVLQKVCNWTLFVPLNTFFDCSNINRIHEENGITIKPSDLINVKDIENNVEKLKIEDLSDSIEEIYKRATEMKPLGKTLKINCMTMSNPPTETEIKRYEEIKQAMRT